MYLRGLWPSLKHRTRARSGVSVGSGGDEGRRGVAGPAVGGEHVVEAYAAEPVSRVTDLTLDDVLAADRWARDTATALVTA